MRSRQNISSSSDRQAAINTPQIGENGGKHQDSPSVDKSQYQAEYEALDLTDTPPVYGKTATGNLTISTGKTVICAPIYMYALVCIPANAMVEGPYEELSTPRN